MKAVASLALATLLLLTSIAPDIQANKGIEPSISPPLLILTVWNITSPIYINDTVSTFNGTIEISQNGSLNLNNATLIFNGTIKIHRNGILVMKNSTLAIASFCDRFYNFLSKVIIYSGGGFFIDDLDDNSSTRQDESRIIATQNDMNHRYAFTAYPNSSLHVINSKITRMVYSAIDPNNSADIRTEDLIISGTVIEFSGIYVSEIVNFTFLDNVVTCTNNDGCFFGFYRTTNITVKNNTFS